MRKKNKQEYYDIRAKLLKVKANYYAIISERTNGKSYQVKDVALERFFKHGHRCALVRRWETDTKKDFTDSYFDDMAANILDYSNGEYDRIIRYGASLYLATTDIETGKAKRGELFGRILWLSGAEHFKSQSLTSIGTIIMEEFITNQGYLPREPTLLMSIISTIARDRMDVMILLVGNTVSRQCPYFYEWGLTNVYKQKQGTVDVYHVDDVTIAIERPDPIVRKSLVIGNARKMTVNGEWDVCDVPIIQDSDITDVLYTVLIEIYDLCYAAELCNVNGKLLARFRPHQSTRRKNTDRVVNLNDNCCITRLLTTPRLSPITKGDKILIDLIRCHNYGFTDKLTGAELQKIIKNGLLA